MNKLILTTAILTLFGAGITQAQTNQISGPTHPTQPNIEEIRKAAYAKSDALMKSQQGRLSQQFKEMDKNLDGQVSKEEYVEYKTQEYKSKQAEFFDKMDGNKDGSLTEQEFESSINDMMKILTDKIIDGVQKSQNPK